MARSLANWMENLALAIVCLVGGTAAPFPEDNGDLASRRPFSKGY